MGLSPEEIANILSGLAMTTARSQGTQAGAQAAYGTTQNALANKYQEELEEERKKKEKAGLFSQIGTLLGGAALAPFTGGMSLPAAAAVSGVGSAAGSALGGALGGADNIGELFGAGVAKAVPQVAGAAGQQVIDQSPVYAKNVPVNADMGNGSPLGTTLPDVATQYTPRALTEDAMLKEKAAVALTNPDLQQIAGLLGGAGVQVDAAKIPVGLDARTGAMLRDQQVQMDEASANRALRQQEMGLRQEEIGIRRDEAAGNAAYREGRLGLEQDSLAETVRKNKISEGQDAAELEARVAAQKADTEMAEKRLALDKEEAAARERYQNASLEIQRTGQDSDEMKKARADLLRAQAETLRYEMDHPKVTEGKASPKVENTYGLMKSLWGAADVDLDKKDNLLGAIRDAASTFTDEEWQELEAYHGMTRKAVEEQIKLENENFGTGSTFVFNNALEVERKQ